ncbi:hypothetical protein CYMTET_23228 [Cymbomonas tetramitiformis]|uniref:Uncharacterized protein n=1 Tax=Cymbomonas tetramitiformis TaxID=36881 RepID=A0AAE0FYQ4_9CHLO|nr:hypothetical protein CYMTET_23228 [Cymbomonas tetramitiformis]
MGHGAQLELYSVTILELPPAPRPSTSTSCDFGFSLEDSRVFAYNKKMSDSPRRRSVSPADQRRRSRDRGEGGGGGGKKRGVATRWNERGFGFIKPNDGSEDVFCHFSAIKDGNALREGDEVEYNSVFDDRKGKYRAEDVTGGRHEERNGGGGFGGGGGGGGGMCRDFEQGRCTRDNCRFSHGDGVAAMVAVVMVVTGEAVVATAVVIKEDRRSFVNMVKLQFVSRSWDCKGDGNLFKQYARVFFVARDTLTSAIPILAEEPAAQVGDDFEAPAGCVGVEPWY